MPEFRLEGEFEAIAKVQEEEQDELMAKTNVVGVGLGHKITKGEIGDPCLSVFVSQKLEPELVRPDDMVDEEVGDATLGKFKTDVVETGELFAGSTKTRAGSTKTRAGRTKTQAPTPRQERFRRVSIPEPSPIVESPLGTAVEEPWVAPVEMEEVEEVVIEALRRRLRPTEGGYSVGHYRITAGTIATAVYDSSPFPGIPRKYYILSNNHVLANSNSARIGDPILQPGPADGGRYPSDMIARLSRYVPIRFGGPLNYVDAAIAEGEFHDLDREIFWIGYVRGVRFLTTTGEPVQKTGRTTNYTTGRVTNINATVNVNYGGGRVARMVRQIVTTNMSAGGDSGSLLCDMNGNAVGLLFAGSSRVTIHNHIRFVQNLLGIRVV